MTQATGDIRNDEHRATDVWPARTRDVSHIGSAYVVEGSGDFGLEDLNLVRRRFPGRRVTLDGDVITVWPASPPGGDPTPPPENG